MGLAPELARVLWGVQVEFLEAAFEAVEKDHGSLDAYLRDGLGLGEPEHQQLRALYLQA
jgi:protein-tyrosine phosphatase